MKAVSITNITVTAAFLGLMGNTAFASGFLCQSENPSDGYRAKVYNEVYHSTRTPKVVVVSNAEEGTLAVGKDEAIEKVSDGETIRYTIEGTEKLGAEKAIVEVTFNENLGDLQAGETTTGQLILVKGGAEQVASQLVCARYLKP